MEAFNWPSILWCQEEGLTYQEGGPGNLRSKLKGDREKRGVIKQAGAEAELLPVPCSGETGSGGGGVEGCLSAYFSL